MRAGGCEPRAAGVRLARREANRAAFVRTTGDVVPNPDPMRRARSSSRQVSLLSVLLAACAAPSVREPTPEPASAVGEAAGPSLEPQTSGTTALLQAVSVVDARTAWVSGHAGTWARTLDGGATWTTGGVTGADSLQFRDVHAASADVAWLMSAGTGEQSRIYRTSDGGRTWTMQYRASEPDAFLDCFAFWDGRRGLAFGDAVRGALFVLLTDDGGATWSRVPPERLPPALPGEGSFAASGTCVATQGSDRAWIGTGNASRARVLRTEDGGRSWSIADAPVVGGEAAGFAAIAFRDERHGVALGGEIGKPQGRGDYVAVTGDGGRSWAAGGRPLFAGAVYGAAFAPGVGATTIVAVGPGGANFSLDDGASWAPLDTLAYWSVGFGAAGAGWMVGPRGRIVKVRFR
jgi:photosystem II stability/assembly factor-like uncharacterized protein